MKKAIWIRLVLLTLISVIICSATSALILQRSYERQTIDNFTTLINLAAKTDTQKDAPALSKLMNQHRITIIEENGNVLSDSHADSNTLDSHEDRPEVSTALSSGTGVSQRYSNTQKKSMLYVAIKENGVIYRVAVPISGLNSSFTRQLPAILAGFLLALLVSSLLSGQIAKSTLLPLETLNTELTNIKNGQYDTPLENSKYDEITALVSSINQLAVNISQSIQDLEKEKDKLSFVLENIQQGLVVIDQDSKILHCNETAKSLFSCSQDNLDGKSLLYLTHQKEVVQSAALCISKKDLYTFDLPMPELDRIYAVSIAYIHSSWLENGCILMFTDVTQDRQAQRLRQEFVANASHELKTPITSIQGFSELLAGGMVTDPQKQKDYLNRIQDHARQMTVIINKILSLSSLDEHTRPKDREQLPVADMAEQMIADAAPLFQEKHLTVHLDCAKDVRLLMSADHFHQLFSNLLSNAIKYNVDGGQVNITFKQVDNKCEMMMKDTGIGIDPKDIPRMFERFYRGSRPKSTTAEGSGLGLSIVKHIVSNYNGQIQVDSTPGIGTTITIKI